MEPFRRVQRRTRWIVLATVVAVLVTVALVWWAAQRSESTADQDARSEPTPTEASTGEPTKSQQPSQERCILSRTLVPTCGAWWGSSQAPGGVSDLIALENVLQQPVPIAHFFHREGRAFPDSDEQAFTRRQPQSSVLFGNIKPGWIAPGEIVSWAEVADGDADAYLDEIARSIVAFDRPVFLAIHHEPEDDVIPTLGSGFTARDYVEMYRHVVNRVESTIERIGSPSTGYPIWVWDVTGYPRWESLWPQLYPGDSYVDWVGYNPYLQEPVGCDFGCVANRGYDSYPDWPGFYDWAVEAFPGKPLMLGEWGVRESTAPGVERAKAEVYLSAPGLLATRFPELRAIIYFNDAKAISNPSSSRIETSEESLVAFRRMIDDPYFRQNHLLED